MKKPEQQGEKRELTTADKMGKIVKILSTCDDAERERVLSSVNALYGRS